MNNDDVNNGKDEDDSSSKNSRRGSTSSTSAPSCEEEDEDDVEGEGAREAEDEDEQGHGVRRAGKGKELREEDWCGGEVCGGVLKPGIVMFNERLPREFEERLSGVWVAGFPTPGVERGGRGL